MAFSLAGFAEGLHPALQQLAQQIHAGQVAKLQLNNLVGGDSGDGQPSETASPLAAGMAPPPMGAQPLGAIQGVQPLSPAGGGQQQQGPPTPVDVPGAQPMPQAGGAPSGSPASGMGAPPAGAGAQPAGGASPGAGPITAGASMGPTPQVQPNGPSAPPQTPLSGVAQPTGNQFHDYLKTYQSMLMDLRRRNPKASPAMILEAAQQEVGAMKGLAPEFSDMMRMQIANQQVDQKYDAILQHSKDLETAQTATTARLQAKLAITWMASDARNKSEELRTKWQVEGRKADAAMAAGARTSAAQIAATARSRDEDVRQAGEDKRAELKANTDMDDKDIDAAVKVYTDALNYQARTYGAQAAAAGKSFTQAPTAPGMPKFTPPARRQSRLAGPQGEPADAAAPAAPAAAGGGGGPPAPGARKAPDGNWYVADPKRPGKYLRVGA